MGKMKTALKVSAIAASVVAGTVLCMGCSCLQPSVAQAETYSKVNFQQARDGSDWSPVEKVKGHYYKYNEQSNKAYVSSSKNGPWKKVIYPRIVSEKAVYSMSSTFPGGKKLYRYNLAKGTKSVALSFNSYVELTAMRGNLAYIAHSGEGEGRAYTFVIDLKKHKRIATYTDCYISDFEKGYAVAREYVPSDVSPYPVDLYKFTSKGMKKVSRIASHAYSEAIRDGKVVYLRYKSRTPAPPTTLSVFDIKKKSTKLIKKFKSSWVRLENCTAKTCDVVTESNDSIKRYRVTFATGKTEYIGKKETDW